MATLTLADKLENVDFVSHDSGPNVKDRYHLTIYNSALKIKFELREQEAVIIVL